MTEFGRGFAQAIEAAAKAVEQHAGSYLEGQRRSSAATMATIIADAIRALSPPSPVVTAGATKDRKPKARQCDRCDFGTGQRGMDRCSRCDGTGSAFFVAERYYANTEKGYEAALEARVDELAAALSASASAVAELWDERNKATRLADENFHRAKAAEAAVAESREENERLHKLNEDTIAVIDEAERGGQK